MTLISDAVARAIVIVKDRVAVLDITTLYLSVIGADLITKEKANNRRDIDAETATGNIDRLSKKG